MPAYEYKIVPAPTKGVKGKGVKGPEARFANALEIQMNEMAAEGWEYQRAETLPSVERSGLTSTTTEWRNVLVYRRLRDDDAEAFAPELLPAPATPAPAPATDTDTSAKEANAKRQDPPLSKVAAKAEPAPAQNTDAKPTGGATTATASNPGDETAKADTADTTEKSD